MNRTDETVLVVGAGRGIGQAAASHLAAQGATVRCADVRVDWAEQTARSIRQAGGQATAHEVNVADVASVERLLEAKGVDADLAALVNCAGITGVTGTSAWDVTVEDFDRVIDVNLRGAFLLTRAVLPRMVEAGYGRILHVASIAGKEGNANMTAYSASKAGLIGLTKSLGKECAATGVTVNALAAGVVDTELVRTLPNEVFNALVEKIPMGRVASLDESSHTINWITSRECSFSTGFAFDLSGGRAVY